ncbi:hypothetical protein pdam_00012525 [Pocillopora damicornis]|uniref:BTB domain-containing protein n=1 Tax=Pocillopora damicornis TaxID=46731 RepID=A0A3M6UXL5_POCDA|nr:hypothetical protein pdam_00012525 [Pocillopora damicornis]
MTPSERRDTMRLESLGGAKPIKELRDRVVLNVGGKVFEPYISTLKNIPDIPLARILDNRSKLDYDPESGEYFFDRHPAVFQQVLNYLQTGKLHCPRNICGPLFEQELAYWGLDEQQMESCCWPNYTKHRDAQENLQALDFRPKYENADGERSRQRFYNDPTLSWWQRNQPIVWEILDDPYSSSTAKVVRKTFLVQNFKQSTLRFSALVTKTELAGSQTPMDVLTIIDSVCTGWFTLEFLLRLAFCPSKFQFAKKLQNWIDLLVIIPLYLLLVFERTTLIEVLNTTRIVRIFRFFKLLYDLQILGKTVKASRHQLGLLLLILLIPVIIFSSLILYTERQWGTEKSKSEFHSLPNAFWWGVITMTTVGYGDIVPASFAGKVVGGIASICGIIILSTSASVIGSTFSLYYNLAQAQLKIPRKQRNFEVDFQSLPAVLACRTSQTDSAVISNTSDSGYQRSPNRLQTCDRNSFVFDANAPSSPRSPCACQSSLDPPIPLKQVSSPRPSVPLTRKASIRRDSILV